MSDHEAEARFWQRKAKEGEAILGFLSSMLEGGDGHAYLGPVDSHPESPVRVLAADPNHEGVWIEARFAPDSDVARLVGYALARWPDERLRAVDGSADLVRISEELASRDPG